MSENKDMSTKVAGVPTGDTTESGNPNHDSNGQFGTGKSKSQIDTDFSVPYCNHKILPVLNQLCQEENANIYDIHDQELQLSPELIEELDKTGTDYIIIKKGKMYSVDLKTTIVGNNRIPNHISIPLWKFDKNYKDEKTGIKGKQVYGWGLKFNDTNAYLFSLPRNVDKANKFDISKHGNIDFDAFFIWKSEFQKILFNNFFDDGINVDGHQAMKSLRDSMFSVNKDLFTELEKRRKKQKQNEIDGIEEKIDLTPADFDGFSIEYDENGKPKVFKKLLPGKDGYNLSLIMSLEYVDGEQFPRQNIYLLCNKNVFKRRDTCQLLNPKENKENILGKYLK